MGGKEMDVEQMVARCVELGELNAAINKHAETLVRRNKKELAELHQALKDALPSGVNRVDTAHGTVSIETQRCVNVTDWESVYTYIMEDPARLELLQKRLSSTAVMAHLGIKDTKQPVSQTALPEGFSTVDLRQVKVKKPRTKVTVPEV